MDYIALAIAVVGLIAYFVRIESKSNQNERDVTDIRRNSLLQDKKLEEQALRINSIETDILMEIRNLSIQFAEFKGRFEAIYEKEKK